MALSVREILTDTIDPDPVKYRGVQMRSKLEADFARHLDEQGLTWQYEPKIFGPVGQGYMPDFYIANGFGRMYVEVKPTLEQANAKKDRMKVIWKAEPDAIIVIVSGDGWWQAATKGGPWDSWRQRWHGYRVKRERPCQP